MSGKVRTCLKQNFWKQIKKHHSHLLSRRCRDTLKLSLIVLETGVKNKRPSAYCTD